MKSNNNKKEYLGITIDYSKDSNVTEFAYETLRDRYFIEGETSYQEALARCITAFDGGDKELAQRLYDAASNFWWVPSTPVLSNGGTKRGLPISCFLNYVDDSLEGFNNHFNENTWLASKGGGIGGCWSSLRSNGVPTSKGSRSSGSIPFMKCIDSQMLAVSQGTCYIEGTEVLTSKGWKDFRNVTYDDKVAQVTDGREIEFVAPLDIIKEYVEEDLVNFSLKDKSLDLTVTKNHSMVISRRKQKNNEKYLSRELEKVRAEDLNLHRDNYIHTTASTSFNSTQTVLSPFERLLVAYQADGRNYSKRDIDKKWKVHFRFKKERKVERLKAILKECGLSYKITTGSEGVFNFHIETSTLEKHFKEWVDLSNVSKEWCVDFIEEVKFWDGHQHLGERGIKYSNTSKEDADIVHSIACLAGRRSKYREIVRTGNRSNIYEVYIRNNYIPINGEKIKKTIVSYSGYVYCTEVPSGMLLVRYKGTTAVCGNTRRGAYAAYQNIDHPEIEEFLLMRRPTGGDPNRKCLNLHHGINITNKFMEAVDRGEPWDLIDPKSKQVVKTVDARKLWEDILIMRVETGEPFVHWIDTTNQAVPEYHKKLGRWVKQSNLCCVTGDQRVYTANLGLVKVKDLAAFGNKLELIGYDPRHSKVVSNASPMYLRSDLEDVYEIRTKEGYIHKVTKEHKVWIKDRGWVETRDLVPGDELQLQPNECNFGSYHLPELAFIAGVHTGDGNTYKSTHLHVFKSKTYHLCSTLERYVEKVIQDNLYDKRSRGHLSPKFGKEYRGSRRLSSKLLFDILEDYKYTKNKVPEFVFSGTRETVARYLEGLYVTDGNLRWDRNKIAVSLTNSNEEFLREIQLLWINLGVKSSIYKSHNGGISEVNFKDRGRVTINQKPCYRLNITSREGCRIADSIVNLSLHREGDTRDKFVETLELPLSSFSKEQNFTATVTEVIKVGQEPVYCPKVYSDNHSWIANGFVTHNSEIVLPTDKDHTAVCCLSSVNLEHFKEWSKTTLVQDLIVFLDNVLQYFIDNAPDTMEKAIRSAKRERSLGLGAMGFHSFLQANMIPMESAMAESWNRKMFKHIREEAEKSTERLGLTKGNCPDYEEYYQSSLYPPRRNAYLMAIAPNASSAIMSNSSPSVEPMSANVYTHKTDSGSFQVVNKFLLALLESRVTGGELKDVLKSIVEHEGSVQHLDILSDEEKEVFKTAFEIDQNWLVHHASVRQQFIDQAQSINLFFTADVNKSILHKVHWSAWKKGLKTLYYCRSKAISRADTLNKAVERTKIDEVPEENSGNYEECLSCSG